MYCRLLTQFSHRECFSNQYQFWRNCSSIIERRMGIQVLLFKERTIFNLLIFNYCTIIQFDHLEEYTSISSILLFPMELLKLNNIFISYFLPIQIMHSCPYSLHFFLTTFLSVKSHLCLQNLSFRCCGLMNILHKLEQRE